MALYDGLVSLGDDEVHVILGVDEETVTLSANGAEIGAWGSEEVAIQYAGGGIYTITAEEETLQFVPNDVDLFAIRFGQINDDERTPKPNGSGKHARVDPETADDGTDRASESEASPPKPATKIAFYVLGGITAFLGLWAIVTLMIG